jgi:hypothetical protein
VLGVVRAGGNWSRPPYLAVVFTATGFGPRGGPRAGLPVPAGQPRPRAAARQPRHGAGPHRRKRQREAPTFPAFDLLVLEGEDLRELTSSLGLSQQWREHPRRPTASSRIYSATRPRACPYTRSSRSPWARGRHHRSRNPRLPPRPPRRGDAPLGPTPLTGSPTGGGRGGGLAGSHQRGPGQDDVSPVGEPAPRSRCRG